jgi:hypothetical protein
MVRYSSAEIPEDVPENVVAMPDAGSAHCMAVN